MYTLHNFVHIFLQNQLFFEFRPHIFMFTVSADVPLVIHDFNGKAPLKICYLKKVYYLYTPCERSLRSRTWLFAKQFCFAIECQRLIQTILH